MWRNLPRKAQSLCRPFYVGIHRLTSAVQPPIEAIVRVRRFAVFCSRIENRPLQTSSVLSARQSPIRNPYRKLTSTASWFSGVNNASITPISSSETQRERAIAFSTTFPKNVKSVFFPKNKGAKAPLFCD